MVVGKDGGNTYVNLFAIVQWLAQLNYEIEMNVVAFLFGSLR